MNDLVFRITNWVDLIITDEKERATGCELQITTANESLFMVEDFRSQSTREYIRVSAYPLAVWLVENYFRLKHEVRVTDAFDHALSHRPKLGFRRCLFAGTPSLFGYRMRLLILQYPN